MELHHPPTAQKHGVVLGRVLRTGLKSGSFLSCRCCSFDRSSRFSWTISLLGKDGCRRHYPGGTVGCCRYPVQRRRPSLKTRQVGFRIILFEACSAFTRVPACMVAKSPKSDPLHQSTSTNLLPPPPPWLLPAERPIGRVGFAPTGDRQLSRHTEFLMRPTGAEIWRRVRWEWRHHCELRSAESERCCTRGQTRA